jgi:kynureninase
MPPDEAFALDQDRRDPLRACRYLFHIPPAPSGGPCIYLTGNSLGLMPRATPAAIEQELDDWKALGVEAHLSGRTPWFSYHEVFREMGARLVGGRTGEVVMMNSLTVNLHLLMVSFYRPTARRYRVMVEDSLFPSDSYAVASQAALHGLDPAEAVIRLKPRRGEQTLRTDDILAAIRDHRDSLALVMLGGVNYLTGQWFEMGPITAAGHDAGAAVGWDLAHAAGNVPLRLHDWDVDFAAWCSYKYLNAGPGAVAGAFVHERHASRPDLPRLAGWWGNDPGSRFQMSPEFVPRPGADGWQLSNPPILAMAPLKVSLAIFDRIGMEALRDKSLRLTGYLESLLREIPGVSIITPTDPAQRGCALSLRFRGDARAVLDGLKSEGIIGDFREPDTLRAAPVPLYNTFQDAWRFAQALRALLPG